MITSSLLTPPPLSFFLYIDTHYKEKLWEYRNLVLCYTYGFCIRTYGFQTPWNKISPRTFGFSRDCIPTNPRTIRSISAGKRNFADCRLEKISWKKYKVGKICKCLCDRPSWWVSGSFYCQQCIQPCLPKIATGRLAKSILESILCAKCVIAILWQTCTVNATLRWRE